MEYDRHRGRVAAKYVKDNLLACVDLQGNEDESRLEKGPGNVSGTIKCHSISENKCQQSEVN